MRSIRYESRLLLAEPAGSSVFEPQTPAVADGPMLSPLAAPDEQRRPAASGRRHAPASNICSVFASGKSACSLASAERMAALPPIGVA